jgi:L-seryl-tRNA(Ser) seleniumtransferase
MRTWHTLIVPEPNPYRELPSVDELADRIETTLPRPLVVEIARSTLERARGALSQGDAPRVDEEFGRSVRNLERNAGAEVVNATGIILHTNLGRARWSSHAADRAMQAATRYTNVELDLRTGERSRRGSYVRDLLQVLTGAEDALVVNNNAAALLLTLAATSNGLAVPVSRGELIEIGGSYRLPLVMEASGARLIEVGTTNRTRIDDYRTALQLHRCGSILRVHPSNYRIEGFTETPDLSALSALSLESGLPLVFDIGSGLLDSETPWISGPTPDWLGDEPAARQALEEGADLVTFSGDKLLGGPQAGIIVGDAKLVDLVRSNPLTRALRVDAVTLSGLGATLEAYANKEIERLPFWRQALLKASTIEQRAGSLARALGGQTKPGTSEIGAGSVPGVAIPTTLVALEGEDHLFGRLLEADPAILCRRESGGLVIDLRTVDADHDPYVVEAVRRCR